ncbi:hypothetical protein [Streptomyces sp. NPDC000983]|uniref:hypothetical protein n=1 Tax=Streptomyces sp. NPDC000983 TaxID=3154373 RepID=UPI00332691FF
MASQNQSAPDGPESGGGPSVRRAVSLGATAADPGPMLAPAAPRTAAGPAPAGAVPEEETATAPETPAGAAATKESPKRESAEQESSRQERPEAEAQAEVEAEAERGTGTSARAAAEGESAGEAAAGVRAVPDTNAGTNVGTDADRAAAAGAGAAGAGGADGPPTGNPKKPLLAAAGLVGVVLLSVPLLIWASDDSDGKKKDVAVAAGSDTLLEEDSLEAPKGDYAPAEPTPEPSSKKPSVKPKPVVKEPAPAPPSTPASEPTATQKTAETKVKENSPPKLPPNTAAYAVQRLAASNAGRHICYRVHVKGSGWTAPACDGATAGREGGGRPITAINVAVANAKRVNGNEFIQKDGWTTEWSGAADGLDLVLGSAASNAPNLSGFTIGVEAGNVCQNHKLGGHGWGGLACESPQGWIFGGTLEPQWWLEAVRFTV